MTLDLLEVKSKLSHLVNLLQSGVEDEIAITRDGKPVALLVPIKTERRGQRIGVARGKFKIPDDIDALNPMIQRLFEGREE